MPFDAILGQAAAVGTLTRALERGRVHHAYRFEGPPGVGKEMAAFALAQALVCTAAPAPGAAMSLGCGRCKACSRAVTLSEQSPRVPTHPDVIIVERGLYPPETIHRQRAELQDISVDQIRRVVLEHAAFPPHEGRARVFIVRRADELSTSAANAMLKTLEEPHNASHFVLITSRGRELLDTIRSRTQLVRFGPLPDAIVAGILERAGVPAERVARAVALAGGSASTALELADPERDDRRRAFVDAVTSAVAAPDLGPALAFAEARDRDKDTLQERLMALSASLVGAARNAAFESTAAASFRARRLAQQQVEVARAMRELERNGAPALVLESMIVRMRRVA